MPSPGRPLDPRLAQLPSRDPRAVEACKIAAEEEAAEVVTEAVDVVVDEVVDVVVEGALVEGATTTTSEVTAA